VWIRRIREGDTRALARAATAVENRDPHPERWPRSGARARRPRPATRASSASPDLPAPAKAPWWTRWRGPCASRGKTVAILAVDPSSRLTGGAILGDRIRMQQHHADPGIFIRSMATRGSTGGLARATADMARLMSAAGKDYVIVETVGVGQDEIGIAGLAHVTVVVLVPGMGDDVQAIKAGILEIADVFAINKSDQPGADRVERELGHAQPGERGWPEAGDCSER
jgi:LAO/AO transport system kinase